MTTGPQSGLLIYTDASYVHAKLQGSWGAVIVWQGTRESFGAPFKGPCSSSTLAELQGVANALHIAVAAGKLRRDVEALVLCDCLSVVQLLNGEVAPTAKRLRRAEYQAAARKVREIVRDVRAAVRFDWVKGHQTPDSDCPHAQGNREADRAATNARPDVDQLRAKKRARERAAKKARRVKKAMLARQQTERTGE